MVIDMDQTRLRTLEQLEEFLKATRGVTFSAAGAGIATDNQRYEHISRKRSANPIFPANPEAASLMSIATTKGGEVDLDRQRLERCLEQVVAYRASGLKATAWAAANKVELRELQSWCAVSV